MVELAPKPLPWRTPIEIATTNSKVEWILPGMLARGVISELVGPMKEGKSTLLLRWIRSVLSGRPWIDVKPPEAGPVLYLTEMLAAELVSMFAKARLMRERDLHVLPWTDVCDDGWEDLIARVEHEAKRVQPALVIVDTLAQFTLGDGWSENDNSDAIAMIKPLQKLAARSRASVLVVRHTPKGGARKPGGGRGAGALGAAVGILHSFYSTGSTERTIQSIGRLPDIPKKLIIEWQNGDYQLVKRIEAPTLEAEDTLVGLLPSSLAELASFMPNTSRSTLRRKLEMLIENGQAWRSGSGTKADPTIYHPTTIEDSRDLPA